MNSKSDPANKAAELRKADSGPVVLEAHDIPDLLNWHEGMLLMPWHFQQSTRRSEALAGWLVQASHPHGWGVRSLTSSLDKGVFQVRALEAVMPDRMMISYRDTEHEALRVDVSAALQKWHQVHVHVAAVRWPGLERGWGGEARYGVAAGAAPLAGLDVQDDETDETFAEKPWLRPRLTLELTEGPLDSLPGRLVGLPLACLILREGAVVHEPYQPPSLALGTFLRGGNGVDSPILEEADLVRRELTRKVAFLKDNLRARRRSAEGGDDPELAPQSRHEVLETVAQFFRSRQPLLDLQAVSRTLPRLNAMISDASATHPQAAFLTLCDVLGDLSAIGGEFRLPDALPGYEHRDLLRSFARVREQIGTILETLNQRYRAVPFEIQKGDDGTVRFRLKKRPASTDAAFVICAFADPGADGTGIDRWMAKARIATEQSMREKPEKRTRGAEREFISEDEALDTRSTTERRLYRIRDSRDDIVKDDPVLIVEGEGENPPAQLYLYVSAKPAAKS